MSSQKQHINIAFIGPEYSGKSVTAGHLIYSCGNLDKSKTAEIEKLAEEKGNSLLKYSYLLNYLHAEYNKSMPFVSPFNFETPKYRFTIIESEYPIKFCINMLDGNYMHNSSNTDAAVLFVDSVEGNFEKDIAKKGLTVEFSTISYIFGIKQLIVAVNKIDEVNYSKDRFEKITTDITKLFTDIGFKQEQYKFIPISSLKGDNILEKSSNLSWWTGGTLIEVLNALNPPVRPTDKPLRFPVQDVFNAKELGTAVIGRVESGILKAGQKVVLKPSGTETTIKSIQRYDKQQIQEARIGESVCCFVDAPYSEVKRGYICGEPVNDPPRECTSFTAKVSILNYHGKISVGYEPLVKCHSACNQCKLVKIVRRTNSTGVDEKPEHIQKGDTAEIVLEPLKPFVVEKFDEYPSLGRFIIREDKHLVAVGVITGVEKKE